MKKRAKSLHETAEGQDKIRKVRELTKLAKDGDWPSKFIIPILPHMILIAELDTTPAALALAWIARNPNTSTVILGASNPQQVLDNLKALEVIPKLTPAILEKIEGILGNTPKPVVRFAVCSANQSAVHSVHFLQHPDTRPRLDKFAKL